MDYTKMYVYIPNVSMSVFLIKLLYKRQNKNVLINVRKITLYFPNGMLSQAINSI